MSFMESKCDSCGFEGEVAVCGSALGPVSFAYCAGCMHENVEPVCMFEATYDLIGEDVAPHVKALSSFVNGKLMSWNEFVEYSKSTDSKP